MRRVCKRQLRRKVVERRGGLTVWLLNSRWIHQGVNNGGLERRHSVMPVIDRLQQNSKTPTALQQVFLPVERNNWHTLFLFCHRNFTELVKNNLTKQNSVWTKIFTESTFYNFDWFFLLGLVRFSGKRQHFNNVF